ncbi:hypothetical protein L0244_00420, partial [bacterium]|nr:hypothetical protein [bacterium]
GNSWQKIEPNLAGGPKDYEYHSQKDRYIYAGTGKGIFVSTNGGLNWTQSAPRGLCTELAVSPSNGNIVYAFDNKGRIIKQSMAENPGLSRQIFRMFSIVQ